MWGCVLDGGFKRKTIVVRIRIMRGDENNLEEMKVSKIGVMGWNRFRLSGFTRYL